MKKRTTEKLFCVPSARLDLRSILMLFSFMGFFSGAILGLLGLVLDPFINAGDGYLIVNILLNITSPITMSVTFTILGLIGYPLYRFVVNRYITLKITGHEQYYIE